MRQLNSGSPNCVLPSSTLFVLASLACLPVGDMIKGSFHAQLLSKRCGTRLIFRTILAENINPFIITAGRMTHTTIIVPFLNWPVGYGSLKPNPDHSRYPCEENAVLRHPFDVDFAVRGCRYDICWSENQFIPGDSRRSRPPFAAPRRGLISIFGKSVYCMKE